MALFSIATTRLPCSLYLLVFSHLVNSNCCYRATQECRYNWFSKASILRELLLNEEGSQVGELPCTGSAQNDNLNQHPSNDTSIGGFGLVSELGLAFLY